MNAFLSSTGACIIDIDCTPNNTWRGKYFVLIIVQVLTHLCTFFTARTVILMECTYCTHTAEKLTGIGLFPEYWPENGLDKGAEVGYPARGEKRTMS